MRTPGLRLAVMAVLTTLCLGDSLGAAQAVPAPAALARSLQQRYASIRDFRATFTQSVRGGVLKTLTTEQRGEVKIKKPGRMRWTYGPPDRNVFVSDGTRVYFYSPGDQTVHTSAVPTGSDMSAAVLFLTGTGNLERDFTPAMPATHPAGEWQITLTPRVRQDEFATLTLWVDRGSLAFTAFSWTDHGGAQNTIRFSNMRENVNLKDTEFVFEIPKGARVVSGGGR